MVGETYANRSNEIDESRERSSGSNSSDREISFSIVKDKIVATLNKTNGWPLVSATSFCLGAALSGYKAIKLEPTFWGGVSLLSWDSVLHLFLDSQSAEFALSHSFLTGFVGASVFQHIFF